MAFTVTAAITKPGDNLYYDQRFRNHLESYINILRMLNPTRHHVEPDLVHQFEGNLYGYLASISQRPEYHWIIMRVNGYHNPYEFGRKQLERATPSVGITLLFPDFNLIGNIRTLYLSKKN